MNRMVPVLLRELASALTIAQAVPESMRDYGDNEIVLSLRNYHMLKEI